MFENELYIDAKRVRFCSIIIMRCGMSDKEKEIQACYEKYGKQCLKDTKGMSIEDEKRYIDENEPKMIKELKEIIKKYDDKRKCKCCGKYTIDKDSIYDICSNCGWESDPIQEDNPNYEGGANELSLNQYKREYFNKRDLKTVLTNFLNNFNAYDINEYFANGFSDDWDNYLKTGTPIEVLDYLNDSFYNIDIDYRNMEMFEGKIKETLNKTLEMLKDRNIIYEEELNTRLSDFFDKEREVIKDMSPQEEIEYIKRENKEEEIKKIYDELKKKYNLE